MLAGSRRALLGKAFNPLSLFAGGAYDGFLIDDLDYNKRWGPNQVALQYTAAQVAGTEVSNSGQRIATLLDRSGGVASGPELISNGDYAGGTSGWSANTANLSVVSGTLRVEGTSGGNGSAYQSWSAVAGEVYTISCTTFGGTSATLRLRVGTAPGDASYLSATAAGTYYVAIPTTGTIYLSLLDGDNAAGTYGDFGAVSARRFYGAVAQQGSSSLRPTHTVSGSTRYLAFDGVDDYLATSLLPSAAMTLAACFRPGAATASAQYVMGGGSGSNNTRVTFGMSAVNGYSEAQLGDGSAIGDTTSIANTDVVLLVRFNASTRQIYKNGALIGSSAYAGGTPAAYPVALGARNNIGTLTQWLNGRLYRAVAVRRYIPDALVVPTMRWLARGVVAF